MSSSWITAFFICAGVSTLCYVVTAIYTWNRLRAFPAASWVAHFSYLWLAKTTYSGRQYWVHRELHKTRGPLVRVGPNEIVTDDPEMMRRINSTSSKWNRDPFYITGKFNPYHDNLFSRLDHQEHKAAKSRTISAYSGRETPDLEAGINRIVQTLIEVIGSKYATATAGSPVPPFLDLYHTSSYFTLDVITRLAFGKEFGYLSEQKDHYGFLHSLHNLWPQMSTCADIPWIRNTLFSPLFLKLLGPKPTDESGFGALMGVANHYVGLRFRPDAKPQQDMLGSMMKHGLNQTECETEGLFMIIAGTETTASVIRSVLVHVMTCPPVYQKLKDEIHTAVQDGSVSEPIAIQEAKKLRYLQAVIYEAIRLRPPLLGFIPKVVPKGGENLLGHHVPGGTAIGFNLSAISRSPKLFGPDAELFRPERLMEVDEQRRKQMERDIELAFGYGQWMCAGKSIAFMEINKVVFEIFISLVSRVIYARVFHPLARFPGPLLNSLTSIPAAYLVYKGNQPQEFKKLHFKYGPVVRTGPNELSFIGADAWEDIYGVQKDGLNFQKDPAWLAVVSPKDGQTGVSMAPPETHARQRNALGATFTNEALLNQEDVLQLHTDRLMEVLKARAKEEKAIDLSSWFTYATFDVIGDVVFGEPFGCLDEGDACRWADAINSIFQSGAWEQAFGQVAGVGTLLQRLMVKALIPSEPKQWRQKHLQGAIDKTMRRISDGTRSHPDMIGHILRNNAVRKARLSETEMLLNMVQFISAGSETTASLLTGWVYFLLANPACYDRVKTEVRSAFMAREEITWASVGKLKYLEATVHEALRLTSPAPCNQHRVVPPQGQGKVIDGHFVPAGTTVAVAPWVAERHPDNFTDPEKFVPERWMGDPRYKKDKLHASQPFGLGVRACVGKNLSYFEARLIMGNLLWQFDMEFDQGQFAQAERKRWDNTEMLVWHVWVKPAMLIQLKERML